MKRTLAMLCALVLLLTNLNCLTVFAQTEEVPSVQTEPVAVTENDGSEETIIWTPMESVDWFSPEDTDAHKPSFYGASMEDELSQAFLAYLKEQFAKCPEYFSVAEYNIPYNRWAELRDLIWYEMPELFHVYSLGCGHSSSTGMVTYITAGYTTYADTEAEYQACLNAIEKNAAKLLAGVKGNNALTDVEKALVLHDRLAVFVEYDLGNVDTDEGGHKIFGTYGALGEGLAVCQGYAMAYMYLLEQVGIESDLCTSNQLWHAWNIVYIDGEPYHVDVTWDDPVNSSSYIFYDDLGRVHHDNFLRSSDGIWDTGHKAYDYTTALTDTRYDKDMWWMESVTSIELLGDKLYMLDSRDGDIYRRDGSQFTKIYQGEDFSYSKLSKVGSKLLISQRKSVLTVDPATGAATTVFTPSYALGVNAFIRGMKYEDGRIYCHIYNDSAPAQQSMPYSEESQTPLKIVQQPTGGYYKNGVMARISVQAQGDSVTYRWWYKDAGQTRWTDSGVTGSEYAVRMAPEMHGRQVYCRVTDQHGAWEDSQVATLYMMSSVTITRQPEDVYAVEGQTATVSVSATGDDLSYQWYFSLADDNGWTLSNVTTPYYEVTMYQAFNGMRLYCIVTDRYGAWEQSQIVTLHVGNGARILRQPQDVFVENGQVARTSVEAIGDGLSYQWFIKSPGASHWNKSSLTGNEYYVTMQASNNGRQVYCVVTDRYGNSVQSDIATLRSGNFAKLVRQPGNVQAPNGATVSVSVEATGDGLTYAWYFKDPGKDTFSLSSITTDTYTAVMNAWRNGRLVYCVVTDQYGNAVISDTVSLIMRNTLKITRQPATKSVVDGKTISVPIAASGEGLTYTWYFKDVGKSSFSKSSVTTNTYTTSMTEAKHNRQIYCVVTDQYGNTLKTNTVYLKVLKITTQPGNAVAPNGKTLTTKVVAKGDGLSYTWYYAKKGSSSYTKASTTSATYSVKSSSSVNGRTVYCVVKDKYGSSVKTRVATLYKGTPAKITTQPKNVTVAIGKTIKITVKASGSGLKYAWYFKDVGKTVFSKSSVTSSTYTGTMKSNANGRQIYCVVTDKYGATVKTNVVTITKAVTARILTQPASTIIVANGGTAKVTLKAEGDGIRYTWYYAKAGSSKYSKLSTTSGTYSVTMDSAKHGRKVYCVVKDKYGNSVKSNVVTLYNASNLIAGSWKESGRQYAEGWTLYLEKMTLTISGTKVTLKAKDTRTGKTNTYTYTLQYTGSSGSNVNYKFANSTETLLVTYNTGTKKLTVKVQDIAQVYFKK